MYLKPYLWDNLSEEIKEGLAIAKATFSKADAVLLQNHYRKGGHAAVPELSLTGLTRPERNRHILGLIFPAVLLIIMLKL